jgi:hypothetical protein
VLGEDELLSVPRSYVHRLVQNLSVLASAIALASSLHFTAMHHARCLLPVHASAFNSMVLMRLLGSERGCKTSDGGR